jgi:hypothetical protein
LRNLDVHEAYRDVANITLAGNSAVKIFYVNRTGIKELHGE